MSSFIQQLARYSMQPRANGQFCLEFDAVVCYIVLNALQLASQLCLFVIGKLVYRREGVAALASMFSQPGDARTVGGITFPVEINTPPKYQLLGIFCLSPVMGCNIINYDVLSATLYQVYFRLLLGS